MSQLVIAKPTGEVVGEIKLQNGGQEKYDKADSIGKTHIRTQLSVKASEQYGFDVFVFEKEAENTP